MKKGQSPAYFFIFIFNDMSLKLSEATNQKIEALDRRAANSNQLVEMRSKYGLLLAVGTTISSFHQLKDKKGDYVYRFQINEGWKENKEGGYHYFRYTSSDVLLDIYSEKEHKSSNQLFQNVLIHHENFWKTKKDKWDKSDSILKECPGVLINNNKIK